MRDRVAIYREILKIAKSRASQAMLHADRPRQRVEEAHLKLIPGLLQCDDERRHHHYLRVDRHRFARACRDGAHLEFEVLWAELETIAGFGKRGDASFANAPLASRVGPIPLDYGRC